MNLWGRGLEKRKLKVGPRTLKTAAAVLIAMAIVDRYGATADKLIFAMLGAMAAVQTTFRESLESCASQIYGVAFGSLVGVLLSPLDVGSLMKVGIGMILIIALYHMLLPKLSPSLPCFILVMLCVSPGMSPLRYAAGRIWDTTIGLGVGLLINLLVVPYDNSLSIRASINALDLAVLRFLEDMFDGDNILPKAEDIDRLIRDLERQLTIFENQALLFQLRRQRQMIGQFQLCKGKASQLLAHMKVLSQMEHPGRLTLESRRRLMVSGADIRDERPLDSVMTLDIVTNYHVERILTLRKELLGILNEWRK